MFMDIINQVLEDFISTSPSQSAKQSMWALRDVLEERRRQDNKWGEQTHPNEWYFPILLEEIGELAKAMLEDHFQYSGAKHSDIRKEAVHACAVALAMIECIDRREAR